jgi:hypothetical protein
MQTNSAAWPEKFSEVVRDIGGPLVSRNFSIDAQFGFALSIASAFRDARTFLATELQRHGRLLRIRRIWLDREKREWHLTHESDFSGADLETASLVSEKLQAALNKAFLLCGHCGEPKNRDKGVLYCREHEYPPRPEYTEEWLCGVLEALKTIAVGTEATIQNINSKAPATPHTAIPEYIAEVVRQIGGFLVHRECSIDAPLTACPGIGRALASTLQFVKERLDLTRTDQPVIAISLRDNNEPILKIGSNIDSAVSFLGDGEITFEEYLKGELIALRKNDAHNQSDDREWTVAQANAVYLELVQIREDQKEYINCDFEAAIRKEFTEEILTNYPKLASPGKLRNLPVGWWPTLVSKCRPSSKSDGEFVTDETVQLIAKTLELCGRSVCAACGADVLSGGDYEQKVYCSAHEWRLCLNQIEFFDLRDRLRTALSANENAKDPKTIGHQYSLDTWAPDIFDSVEDQIESLRERVQLHLREHFAKALSDNFTLDGISIGWLPRVIPMIESMSSEWIPHGIALINVAKSSFKPISAKPGKRPDRIDGVLRFGHAIRRRLTKIAAEHCALCGVLLDPSGTQEALAERFCEKHSGGVDVAQTSTINPLLKSIRAAFAECDPFNFTIDRRESVNPKDTPKTDGKGTENVAPTLQTLTPIPDLPPPDSTKNSEISRLLREYEPLSKPMPLLATDWNPDRLCQQLGEEFPWVDVAGLQHYLVLSRHARPQAFFRSPNLLLTGPPGTGKSAFARRLAEIVGLPVYTHNCAGSSDARTILGTARGWGNATPGIIPTMMKVNKSANFLVVLEDLDRASPSNHNGRISDAVLPYLEASTAKSVLDECLQANVNASAVSWVITCNSITHLDQAILSRCRIIQVKRPDARHFDSVHAGILRSVAIEFGCDVSDLPELDDEIVEMLFNAFCKSLNLRELNRIYIKVLSIAAQQSRTLQ